ncbi:MAG: hypothetical protein K2N58_07985, partial [Treponemataceae bacterium]|nr:hypothetical protein [Treponemataceae bacterium]
PPQPPPPPPPPPRAPLATLFLAILICFASCDNGSTSSSSEKNPEELVSYELNGDAIKLYDDNTFVITLKENAGTISGTYSNLTSGHKLMVTKASGDIAKSGDILRLSVADGKVSVASSDITRYSTGDGGKVTEGTTPTTPSGSQGSADSDTDYSLGDAPNGNRLSEDYFTFKECDDGIYFECTVPAGTFQSRVYIDGVGQIAEQILYNDKRNRGNFFYPFLDSGKEYTVRVVFYREEDQDDEGFALNYINGDGVVGWFETKVSAGAKSKGEVCVTDSGEIEVKPNGDFRYTKRPTFKNENLLPEDWMINIGIVEGVSWMHEGRKTKWSGEVNIPQKELTQTRNLYTDCSWKSENVKIQFICHRPILYYKYDGKEYRYQWDGPAVDTPDVKAEEELWANINVKNASDVAKIKGTWTQKSEYDTQRYGNSYHVVYNYTLTINTTNVKRTESYTYTNSDDSIFTKEKLLGNRDFYSYYSYYGENGYGIKSSEVAEFENKLNNDSNILKFEKVAYGKIETSESELEETYCYTIYTLDSNVSISNDGKTLTQKYENQYESLSEIFEDRQDSDGEVIKYYIKLFTDGSTLQVIESRKYPYEEERRYQTDYKKQQ